MKMRLLFVLLISLTFMSTPVALAAKEVLDV
jgi:hypothetical protein